MINMFKSKKFLFILIVIVVLVLGFGSYVYSELNVSKKPWSMVYLTTGEIYIGKISNFPRLQIHDVYIFQMVRKLVEPTEGGVINEQSKTEASFQLTPLKDALWAPKKLYLNSKQVIFYGPLRQDSKALKAIREAGK